MNRIVTAIYGAHHLPFLAVLAESARRVGHDLLVVYDELDSVVVREAVGAAPMLVWAQGRTFGEERTTRVARKVVAWAAGLQACTLGDRVALLDADTMVVGRLDDAFSDVLGAADVAYTVRPGRWLINSGVVFARVSAATRAFVWSWADLTEWVLERAARRAVDGHGAADQAALAMARELWCRSLGFLEVPCSLWNESECPGKGSRIRHLKGLLPYLLGEKEFVPGDEHYGHDHGTLFGAWREMYAAAQEGGR